MFCLMFTNLYKPLMLLLKYLLVLFYVHYRDQLLVLHQGKQFSHGAPEEVLVEPGLLDLAYEMGLPRRAFPAPDPLPARAVDHGPSENATCPYSGDPVTDFMEMDGRIFGFCNPFCRDKTVADPEVWPEFMAIYQS